MTTIKRLLELIELDEQEFSDGLFDPDYLDQEDCDLIKKDRKRKTHSRKNNDTSSIAENIATTKTTGAFNSIDIAKRLGNEQTVRPLTSALNKIKSGRDITTRQEVMALASAFVELLYMDPRETQDILIRFKRVQRKKSDTPT